MDRVILHHFSPFLKPQTFTFPENYDKIRKTLTTTNPVILQLRSCVASLRMTTFSDNEKFSILNF